METNAASSNGLGVYHLKNELLPADRLAFEIVQLEMTFLGVGTPDFIIPGQTPGTVTLNQYPTGSDDDMLPFMIAKGHRIGTGAATDPLTGFGWLSENGERIATRDFLFVVGPPIPEPNSLAMFGAGLLVLGAAALRKSSGR